MLAHLFDRFYIVTKFMLPSMGDIKFSKLNFDHTCAYMNEYAPNMDSRKYLTELKTYCNKIKPFVTHYINLIKSYNTTIYNILENEIRPLLPQVLLYNVLLINQYIGNITIKHHSKNMGDNRDPTVILHQEISSLPVSIASDTGCF